MMQKWQKLQIEINAIMNYHKYAIKKDDMLNGEGLEKFFGFQDVPIDVRDVTTLKHGMSLAVFLLMLKLKLKSLQNLIKITFSGITSVVVVIRSTLPQ